jgi:hypothetical protein
MTDKLKTRIETDEYIYEEYHSMDTSVGYNGNIISPSMTAWNRSMRSLFNLQNALGSFPEGDVDESPDCFKHIYEQRKRMNRCVCDECYKGDEKNDE